MTTDTDSIATILELFRKETAIHSSMVDILHKPSAQALLSIGEPVVTHVFRHEVELDIHLMTILGKITKENPVPKEQVGIVREMREYWLNWASQNNYL